LNKSKSVVILCDLIVDLGMRFKSFPINAGDVQRLTSLQITAGGASNVAIMAARLGLSVTGLAEIGDDVFGNLLLSKLADEGIDTSAMKIVVGGTTPVAGVLVDEKSEPAYLGTNGSGKLKSLPKSWSEKIGNTDAIYASGWADHTGVTKLILKGFKVAKTLGKIVFFDLGPGNPEIDNSWINDVVKLTDVLSCNEEEALKWSGATTFKQAAGYFFSHGVKMVVLKRGAKGCSVITKHEWVELPAYPVNVVDNTGAGDSVTGALLYAVLNEWPLNEIGVLANLTGGAKVQKLGTGENLPTIKEIQRMMKNNDIKFSSKFLG
jgi:sugar/nucleoside kinase (ribokinase family)